MCPSRQCRYLLGICSLHHSSLSFITPRNALPKPRNDSPVFSLYPPRRQPISLNDVVNADAIEDTGILDDPEVQNALIPLLAPGQQNQAELRDIVSGTTAAVLVRGQCFFG